MLHHVMIEVRTTTDDDRNRSDAEIRLSPGISALLPIREHDLGDLALGGWRVFA